MLSVKYDFNMLIKSLVLLIICDIESNLSFKNLKCYSPNVKLLIYINQLQSVIVFKLLFTLRLLAVNLFVRHQMLPAVTQRGQTTSKIINLQPRFLPHMDQRSLCQHGFVIAVYMIELVVSVSLAKAHRKI